MKKLLLLLFLTPPVLSAQTLEWTKKVPDDLTQIIDMKRDPAGDFYILGKSTPAGMPYIAKLDTKVNTVLRVDLEGTEHLNCKAFKFNNACNIVSVGNFRHSMPVQGVTIYGSHWTPGYLFELNAAGALEALAFIPAY